MGDSGYWLGLERAAGLRHAEDLAAAAHRRLLRAAGAAVAAGAHPRPLRLVRALAAAGTAAARLRAGWRRPTEVPATVEAAPQPVASLLLD